MSDTITDRGLTWGERLSDRVNPILVREVLQALHGKMFLLTLATAVASLILIALWVAAFDNTDITSGREVFVAALVVLAPIVVFVVPLQAFMSMRHEVSGGMDEQLLLTGLTPRRIVVGKLLASLLMFVLFTGMFSPLLAMTYLLRGIDVPTIAVMILCAAMASLVANAFAIGMASLGRIRVLAPVTMIVTIGGLVFATILCMAGAWELVREIQGAIGTTEFTEVFGGVILGFFATVWLFGAVAAAVLAHEHENRSTPFRLFVLIGTIAGFGWIGMVADARWIDDVAPGAASIMALVFAPVLIALACEKDELSPRVRTYVPKRSAIATLITPLLPGGGRALLLLLLAGGIAIGFGALLPWLNGYAPDRRMFWLAVGSWAYLWIFASIGRFARQKMENISTRFWAALVIALVTFVLGMIFSLVIFAVTGDDDWSVAHVFNVPWTLSRIERGRDLWILGVIGLGGLIWMMLNLASLARGLGEVGAASRERAQRTLSAD